MLLCLHSVFSLSDLRPSAFCIHSLKFAQAGFKIAGEGNVDYERADLSKSIDHKAKASIRPNSLGDAATEIIETLSDISVRVGVCVPIATQNMLFLL